MSSIQPLADRIVAEPLEASSKTASGLYLPADAKEELKLAKVVAVGKDVKEVKTGDTVIHDAYTKYKVDNKEYVIVKEEDVQAIVK